MSQATAHITSADIVNIIRSRPASALSSLPPVWQHLSGAQGTSGLTDAQRRDYVEAARIFAYHGTPLSMESLSALGHDFDRARYPDFAALAQSATGDIATRTVAAVQDLFTTFGYAMPAAFYDILLKTGLRDDASAMLLMFRDRENLMEDRLDDAALHAVLLVTPLSLYMHGVFSQHGLCFMHAMDCGCKITRAKHEAFSAPLDASLTAAYLQNMMAAAFEQYGVNAATSRSARGF